MDGRLDDSDPRHSHNKKSAHHCLQEKGYRDYGHDMDNTDTLLDVGLSFTCDFDKSVPFIGQDHVQAQKQRSRNDGGLSKRLVSVLVKDPEPLLHHGEILWRNDGPVADVRAASYGHSLGGAVGLAMLERDEQVIDKTFIQEGVWRVQVGNDYYPVELSFQPLLDPKGLRIKA